MCFIVQLSRLANVTRDVVSARAQTLGGLSCHRLNSPAAGCRAFARCVAPVGREMHQAQRARLVDAWLERQLREDLADHHISSRAAAEGAGRSRDDIAAQSHGRRPEPATETARVPQRRATARRASGRGATARERHGHLDERDVEYLARDPSSHRRRRRERSGQSRVESPDLAQVTATEEVSRSSAGSPARPELRHASGLRSRSWAGVTALRWVPSGSRHPVREVPSSPSCPAFIGLPGHRGLR